LDALLSIALIIGAYLVGSVPTSYLIGRVAGGIDIRDLGSGNIGASNLTKQVGAKWAVPVVIFDIFLKGSLPVVLASEGVLNLGISIEVTAGIAGVLGHNWSIFSGLKGGRGLATILGVTVILSYPLVVVFGLIPALGVLFTPWKDSAIWWLVAVVLVPVWAVILNLPAEVVWFTVTIALVTATKRMTSNSLRDDQGSVSVSLLLTRLVFDRDIANREEWIGQ
jgi:glycerol-3-phosphate acyltransferase PlsY